MQIKRVPKIRLNYVLNKIKQGVFDQDEMIDFMITKCDIDEDDRTLTEFRRLIGYQDMARRLRTIEDQEEYMRKYAKNNPKEYGDLVSNVG